MDEKFNKLVITYVNIDDVHPYERNPRNNEKAVDAVAKSISEYGFKVPVILDENNVVVAGHTRILAAKKLGITEIPVVMADDLTPEQIRAFRIADNKVADLSIFDNKLLLEELEEIGPDLFTGFDTSDLFDDTLDESDNDVLEDNESGVVYTVQLKTQDKDRAESVKAFIESVKDDG